MKDDSNIEGDDNVIDLGTNVVFKTVYKTIRANGRSFVVEEKEQVEPELPERKKALKPGRGRPKKKKDPVPMEDNPSIDMDSLMEQAMEQVGDE